MTEEEAKKAREDKREKARKRSAEYYADHREHILEQRRLLWAVCPSLLEKKRERDAKRKRDTYVPKTPTPRPEKKRMTIIDRKTRRIQQRNEKIQRKADAFRAKLIEQENHIKD